MSKIVIGIDQSYKRTGITVIQDNEIRETLSVSMAEWYMVYIISSLITMNSVLQKGKRT